MSTETDMSRLRGQRLAMLTAPGVTESADRFDHTMTVAMVPGEHLADIAELIGLDRDVETSRSHPAVCAS